MRWRSSPGKPRSGYTLTELLVVLAVVVLLGGLSIPNLVGGDDRYILVGEANKIKQLLTEAKTRSLAPTKNDSSGAQVYQVSFSPFPANATDADKLTAKGNNNTNQVTFQRGLANCSSGELQANPVEIESFRLSRGIYISSFYPTNQGASDATASVRFQVGKVGFVCGKQENPSIDSTDFTDSIWQGTNSNGNPTQARYLVIELSSTKIKQTAYVMVDRLSSEISVERSNAQNYFTPGYDQWPPKWNDPLTQELNVSCGSELSTINLKFSRASDVYNAAGSSDPNRLVFYDIYWGIDSETAANQLTPLTTKYFYPLDQDQVEYTFQTDRLTVNGQPQKFNFRIWAYDALNNYQSDSPPAETAYRGFNFEISTAPGTERGCPRAGTEQPSHGSDSSSANLSSDNDPFGQDQNPGTDDITDPAEEPGVSGGKLNLIPVE